jgi:serine/threonine protein kinase
MKYRMPIKEMIKRRLVYPDEEAHARVILRDIEATLCPETNLDEVLSEYSKDDRNKVGTKISGPDATATHFLSAGGMSVIYIAIQDIFKNLSVKTGKTIQELKDEHKEVGTIELSRRYNTSLLDRMYACKFMRDNVRHDEKARLRFQREGDLYLRKLKHPCVPHAIYAGKYSTKERDEDEDDANLVNLITYFPQRIPFSSVINRALRKVRQRAEIAKNAIGVLADIHDQTKKQGRIIIHRDYKPENIWVFPPWISDNLSAIVGDWGLVSSYELSHDTTQVTNVNIWEGTPRYASTDECVASKKAYTHLSEQYVAAVVLWEALTGTAVPYFNPQSKLDTIMNIQEWARDNPYHNYDEKLKIRQYNRDVPEKVEKVVLRAMSKKPKNRYPSMRHFHDALCDALSDWPMESSPIKRKPTIVVPYSDVVRAQCEAHINAQPTIVIARPEEGGTLYLVTNPTLTQEHAPDAEVLEWPDKAKTMPGTDDNKTDVIDPEDFTPTVIIPRKELQSRSQKDREKIRPNTSAFDLPKEEQDALFPDFPDEDEDDED